MPKLEMTAEQEKHLANIETAFLAKVDRKYRRGAAEHGGNLWELGAIELVENALDEAIDQVTYLETLLEKLKGTKQETHNG